MKRKIAFFITLIYFSILSASAQIVNPVKWTSSIEMTDGVHGTIVLSAKINSGWHMYSHDVDPDIGPTPLSIQWDKLDGVKLDGDFKADKAVHTEFDELFGANLSWWTESVVLRQPFTATAAKFAIEATIRYSACNNENCIPPTKETVILSGTAKLPAAQPAVEEKAAPDTIETATLDEVIADDEVKPEVDTDRLWAPVTYSDSDTHDDYSSTSLWYIFFACFIGGFVALLTPCVWPMIPLTVSFFLKKGKSRARSVTDAFVYGLSIIVIYLLLGLLITAIFGASSLNALSTSATCNIIFFLLLVVFAISFFGAFDIKLPASWANKMDSSAERTTGLLSIFFMAFTLTLGTLPRPQHRHTARGGRKHRRQARPGRRHVRLLARTGNTLLPVCNVPVTAPERTPFGRMDEHRQGGARLHRTCPFAQVPLGSRPRLRMAHTRP